MPLFFVFPVAPSNPYSVRLSAVSQRLATVTFMKPDSHGGVPINYYLVQYKEVGSQDWRDVKSHSVQSKCKLYFYPQLSLPPLFFMPVTFPKNRCNIHWLSEMGETFIRCQVWPNYILLLWSLLKALFNSFPYPFSFYGSGRLNFIRSMKKHESIYILSLFYGNLKIFYQNIPASWKHCQQLILTHIFTISLLSFLQSNDV